VSLFWRIFWLNAAVLVIALTLLVFTPATVSTPVLPAEAVVLLVGLVGILVANAATLRIGLAPLRRLTDVMTTIDLLRPGRRLSVDGPAEVADLLRTFNIMVDRLEHERAASSRRVLSAQEEERRRIAQELHDEVGQTLTAVLLGLKRVADQAPESVRQDLREVQETTRDSLDEIRRIARRLRPGVLEELGLVSALKAISTEVSAHTGLAVQRRIAGDLPELAHDTELVVYRVAQEAITNAVRHAGARQLNLTLARRGDGVELRIADDGCGLHRAPEGAGIRGMRERALLIGAELTVGAGALGGTEVCLTVPDPNGRL
jgi:two-component system, NarL family, sensor histidine kinase UhpB